MAGGAGGENAKEKSFYIVSTSVELSMRRLLVFPATIISEDSTHQGEGRASTV